MAKNKQPLPGLPAMAAYRGKPDVIKILEETLLAAKSGEIIAVGVISVMGPDNVACSWVGGFPATVIMGCQQLAGTMLDAVFKRGKSPSIIRPRAN